MTFEEACFRLSDILQDPIPKETRNAFDELRMIRNKIVHFSPPGGDTIGLEAVKSQNRTRSCALKAWALLVNLLETQGAEPFSELKGLVEEVGNARRKTEAHLNLDQGDHATFRD